MAAKTPTPNLLIFVVAFVAVTFCANPSYAQRNARDAIRAKEEMLEQEAKWNATKKLTLRKGLDVKNMPYPGSIDEDTRIEDMEVGDVGKMGYWNFKVLSIVDAENCLLLLGSKVYWLTGYPTEGLSDDQAVRIVDPVRLQESRKYESVGGASKTVRCLKMLDPEESEKWESKKKLGPGFEEYKLADGEAFLGRFLEIRNGAIFETETGKKVRKKLEEFDEASQNRIREKIKANRGKR